METIEAVILIVQDYEQPHDIRLHAIDALRRVNNRQPETIAQLKALKKVQYGLLPVFQNTKERTDVRMAIAAMLITSAVTINVPSKQALIDQIVYSMQNDQNEDVVCFVTNVMEGLTSSQVPQHQNM